MIGKPITRRAFLSLDAFGPGSAHGLRPSVASGARATSLLTSNVEHAETGTLQYQSTGWRGRLLVDFLAFAKDVPHGGIWVLDEKTRSGSGSPIVHVLFGGSYIPSYGLEKFIPLKYRNVWKGTSRILPRPDGS